MFEHNIMKTHQYLQEA